MIPHRLTRRLLEEIEQGRGYALTLATEEQLTSIQAEATRCHDNADRWAKTHEGFCVVKGWAHAGSYIFEKHSVGRAPNGQLLCVSPRSPQAYNGPFVIHDHRWETAPFAALPNQIGLEISTSAPTQSLQSGGHCQQRRP